MPLALSVAGVMVRYRDCMRHEDSLADVAPI
jgi:hypothetical protein